MACRHRSRAARSPAGCPTHLPSPTTSASGSSSLWGHRPVAHSRWRSLR